MARDDGYELRPREMRLDARRRHGRARGRGDRHGPTAVARTAPAAPSLEKQIARGLNGDPTGSGVARAVASARRGTARAAVDPLRALLRELDARGISPLYDDEAMFGLGRLAALRLRWLRRPSDWTVPADGADNSPRAALASLTRHLLCRYPVPALFDDAWLGDEGVRRPGRAWFIHVGLGHNLRTAGGLPFPLTKRMAHHAMLARPSLGVGGALRYGQLVALGVSERRARTAAAVPGLAPPLPGPGGEAFAESVGRFLARHAAEVTRHEVRPMLDFAVARRFGELAAGDAVGDPTFTMEGRTVASVRRLMNDWHERLWRVERAAAFESWHGVGLGGVVRPDATATARPGGDKGPPRWEAVELTDSDVLDAEGRTMHHCVGSYAHRAASGSCAIVSLRPADGDDRRPRVTVEVDLLTRRVVQARGPCNARPSEEAFAVLRTWANRHGLGVGRDL